MIYLLDTCALLWLVEGSHLTAVVLEELEAADAVLVSPISAFEIGIKHSKNLLQLPYSPDEWYGRALAYHSIGEAPLTANLLFAATSLPRIHNDPCDRIIAATALNLDATVITADSVFLNYGVTTRL